MITYTLVDYNDSCFTDKLNARFGYDDDAKSTVIAAEGVQAKNNIVYWNY